MSLDAIIICLLVVFLASLCLWAVRRYTMHPSHQLASSRNHISKFSSLGAVTPPLAIRLVRPDSFYREHRDATMRYLAGVYPLGTQSFAALGHLDLARFFNSLAFYYSCGFNHTLKTLEAGRSGTFPTVWDALPCASRYPLPYHPQGWFYDFRAYDADGTAFNYSDSLGRIGGHCRPGIAFTNEGSKARAGPGPNYINCRALIRYCHKADSNFPDGSAAVCVKRQWAEGLVEGSYVEVTHSQPTPGMVQSLGFWFNAMSGTGLFYRLGKPLQVPSKLAAFLALLSQLGRENPELLRRHFGGLADPYEIVYSHLAYDGHETLGGFRENTFCQWRYVNCNHWKNPMAVAPGEYVGESTVGSFYAEVVRFQTAQRISESAVPVAAGIRAAIDAAIAGTDASLERISVSPLCDEPIFFLASLLGYESVLLVRDPNGNGFRAFEIIDTRVPAEGKYRNVADEIRRRDYSGFIGKWRGKTLGHLAPVTHQDDASAEHNAYYPDFIELWMQKLMRDRIITVRNPLAMDSESAPCTGLGLAAHLCPDNTAFGGTWYNMYCDSVPLSVAYRCLQLGEDAGDSPCHTAGPRQNC